MASIIRGQCRGVGLGEVRVGVRVHASRPEAEDAPSRGLSCSVKASPLSFGGAHLRVWDMVDSPVVGPTGPGRRPVPPRRQFPGLAHFEGTQGHVLCRGSLTHCEISERPVNFEQTADIDVERILSKLGFTARSHAIADRAEPFVLALSRTRVERSPMKGRLAEGSGVRRPYGTDAELERFAVGFRRKVSSFDALCRAATSKFACCGQTHFVRSALVVNACLRLGQTSCRICGSHRDMFLGRTGGLPLCRQLLSVAQDDSFSDTAWETRPPRASAPLAALRSCGGPSPNTTCC